MNFKCADDEVFGLEFIVNCLEKVVPSAKAGDSHASRMTRRLIKRMDPTKDQNQHFKQLFRRLAEFEIGNLAGSSCQILEVLPSVTVMIIGNCGLELRPAVFS